MRIKLCSQSTDLKNHERIKICVKNHLYKFSFEKQKKNKQTDHVIGLPSRFVWKCGHWGGQLFVILEQSEKKLYVKFAEI